MLSGVFGLGVFWVLYVPFVEWWCFPLVYCWEFRIISSSDQCVGVAWCSFMLAFLLTFILFGIPCSSCGLGVLIHSKIGALPLVVFWPVVHFVVVLYVALFSLTNFLV